MARVFKISNESEAPDWFVNQPSKPSKFSGSTADADRIVSLPNELTETGFDKELDTIAKCAETKSPYFYNSKWDGETINKIQEFAMAYEVPAIPADPTDPSVITAATNKSESVVKTAATTISRNVTIDDPFKIDSKGDMSHMNKAVWQKPSKESIAVSPNVFMNSGAVIRLNGVEDSRIHPHLKIAPGQNSVTNPKAIEELSKKEDTGERLRREAKELEAERKNARKEWESNIIDQSKLSPHSTAKGNVKKIDIAPAGGKHFGSMHLNSMPEKTEGEQLRELREARRKEIQRQVEDEHVWDDLRGTTKAKVSEMLLANLENNLNKITSVKKANDSSKK